MLEGYVSNLYGMKFIVDDAVPDGFVVLSSDDSIGVIDLNDGGKSWIAKKPDIQAMRLEKYIKEVLNGKYD